jgi:threonine/homoserine/homoserine lactone efflux protein
MEPLAGAFVAGALAGYGVAIPVGAIAVLIVESAVRRGFRVGAAAGAGAASADGIYAAIAVVAGTALARLLEPWSSPLRIVSAAVLVLIAVRGLLRLRTRAPSMNATGEADPSIGPGPAATYARFLGLTLLNPMTVVYFGALVLGLPAIGTGAPDRIVFVVAAFLASLSWQTVIAGFGALVHHRLPPSAATVTSLLGNVIVLVFAASIALAAIRG